MGERVWRGTLGHVLISVGGFSVVLATIGNDVRAGVQGHLSASENLGCTTRREGFQSGLFASIDVVIIFESGNPISENELLVRIPSIIDYVDCRHAANWFDRGNWN